MPSLPRRCRSRSSRTARAPAAGAHWRRSEGTQTGPGQGPEQSREESAWEVSSGWTCWEQRAATTDGAGPSNGPLYGRYADSPGIRRSVEVEHFHVCRADAPAARGRRCPPRGPDRIRAANAGGLGVQRRSEVLALSTSIASIKPALGKFTQGRLRQGCGASDRKGAGCTQRRPARGSTRAACAAAHPSGFAPSGTGR